MHQENLVGKPGEIPIASTREQLEVLARANNIHPGYIEAPCASTSEDVDACELFKLRWTVSQLVVALGSMRIDPTNAERIANVTLARRHLEDAQHRLCLALDATHEIFHN